MKNLTLGILMLIMLTPSLACAMAFCPMQKTEASEMSCHESNDNGNILMLALDCMGVDLFQKDVSNDINPDQSTEKIDLVWIDLQNQTSAQLRSAHEIRGPPERLDIAQTRPSIILTTQRLRI